MKFMEGKRVYQKDRKSKLVKETINTTIFKNYSSDKTDYNGVDLYDNL